MPCLILILALLTPRLALFLMWLFSDYLNRAFETALWPILGFCFLPVTTLAYAVARNEGGGLHDGWIALFVLGILIDFGVIGGSRHRQREPARR